MQNNYQAGYSLLTTLVSSTIGMLLCGTAVHFMYLTINTYNKIQQKFVVQHTSLMARQLLGTDLLTTNSSVSCCKVGLELCSHLITPAIQALIEQGKIKPWSDLLILQTTNSSIIYYLRKSTLQDRASRGHTPRFALYRDDIEHNAIAIAEELQNFEVQIATTTAREQQVSIAMRFINNKVTKFTCILPQ
jgi:hypothetical protein